MPRSMDTQCTEFVGNFASVSGTLAPLSASPEGCDAHLNLEIPAQLEVHLSFHLDPESI